VEDQRTHGDVW